MIIKQIEAKDTYNIRHQVLRPNLPIETCQFDNDMDEDSFHLGGYNEDQLTSIASFYLDNNSQFPEEFQYRLRGMATIKEFRGRGYSTDLLSTAFPLIKNNHVKVLWCNARTESTEFYSKMGFETIGNVFDIDGVGPHFLMKKLI